MKRRITTLLVALTAIGLALTGTPALAKSRGPGQPVSIVDLGPGRLDALANYLAPYLNQHAKPPLVLVHGWRGLNSSAPCLTNAPDPSNYPDNYWLHLDEDLAAQGFSITYAKLITGYGFDGSTPGCSPVAEANVPRLIAAIDTALAANPGQEKVILIAHSMGGLVSRAYLESATYRDDVVELYTLGTPHLGVPINGLVLIAQALSLGTIDLADFCTSQPVACQFSDDEGLVRGLGLSGIATFNAIHNQRRAGVHYHLVGGDADFGDRSILGAIMDGILFNAPDDGIVPRDSATGLNSFANNLGPLAGPYDRRNTYELHTESLADSASLTDSPQRHYTYFSQDEYVVGCFGFCEQLGQRLTSESFNGCLEPVIGARQPDHVCNEGSLIPLASPPPRPSLTAMAPTEFQSLAPGQSLARSIWLEGGAAMLFARAEDSSVIEVSLRAPDGRLIDPAASSPEVRAKVEENAAVYTLLQAQPGEWQLIIEAVSAPAGKVKTMTWANYQSNVDMGMAVDQGLYQPGDQGVLTVSLDGAPQQAVVEAVIGSGAAAQSIGLTKQGGLYRAAFSAPEAAGYQQLRVRVSGQTAAGLPFAQEHRNILPVAAETFSLTGSYADALQPALSSQMLAPDLVVTVGVEAQAPGTVGVAADLVDDRGEVIASSNAFGQVEPGEQTLSLRFAGRELYNHARPGPYRLANVRLVDYSAGGLIVETSDPAHTTAGYQLSTFAASTTALPHQAEATIQIDNSAHSCIVTPSNSLGTQLAVGDTFRVECEIDLDNAGQYPEWLDYYYLSTPPGWPLTQQSTPPPNVGGWIEPLTATFDETTGLAYWGPAYAGPADLDLARGILPGPGTFWGPWRPDTGQPHRFSLSLAVPAWLPACPGSPFIGLPSAGQSITAVGLGDLVRHNVSATTTPFGGYLCPLPQVGLSLTVSTDGTCPGSSAVSVPEAEQTVTFCYRLTNRSEAVTVTSHSLDNMLTDDQTLTLPLGPGVSHSYSVQTTLAEQSGRCYDNTVTWTAETETGFGQPQGSGADAAYENTTYRATSIATARVCVGVAAAPPEGDIYLPLIVR